ncbi:DUF3089 domain-containing protein [Acetobacterium paludosum]|uniref:DUF3089 domain-containing protein n=1 Tax=Acetobacterium paludosum TaxID=52693 RepID=A0A923HR79_9FIRM|nr:DUF3089 domain-containing protein [Acetobacterium paludosum]MBC3886906.1 DUF3089 domain-containing protein [Acetobacterium paludosum]
MKRKKIALAVAILSLSMLLTACGNKKDVTDYSKTENWMNLPTTTDKEVDVFYLYPTTYSPADQTNPSISTIDDAGMVQNAKIAYGRQATAFETVGNIYAPYYRQDNLSPVDREETIAGIPTTDATAAFDYYIKHYNNGRPFILVGHSQGADVMSNLLSGYLKDHPDVYKRMVVAYVIGFTVTNDYLTANPHLKFAEGPDDTGVIVSYNTEAETVLPPGNPVVTEGALVINPINWKRDETLATAAENLGSIALNRDGSAVLNAEGKIEPVMNFADAQINLAKGVLICSTANVDLLSPGSATFGKGVYHTFDYPFYYFNLRENAENRTNKYFEINGTK